MCVSRACCLPRDSWCCTMARHICRGDMTTTVSCHQSHACARSVFLTKLKVINHPSINCFHFHTILNLFFSFVRFSKMLNYHRVVLVSMARCLLPQSRLYARHTRKDTPWSKAVLKSKTANPGIEHQLSVKRELEVDGVEDIGDYEADFTQLHKVYRDHQQEMEAKDERLKYLIVRNKYFKPTERQNFLTWAEKEQIRNLYKTDPKEWPIQKLVESFPATEEIIWKVIRGKWSPQNMNRIRKHDASVRETWKSFEAGTLNELHPDFVEHLKKFSHRSFESASNAFTNAANDQVQFQIPKPKSREFIHIIGSLPKPKQKPVQIEAAEDTKTTILVNDEKPSQSMPPPPKGDTYVIGHVRGNTYRTLDEYERIKTPKGAASTQTPTIRRPLLTANEHAGQPAVKESRNENGLAEVAAKNTLPLDHVPPSPLSQIDRHAMVKNPGGTGIVVDLNERNNFELGRYVQKYNTRTVPFKQHDPKDGIQITEIKERIIIPRKAYKRGAIFKVGDVFYDDDGELLYRVPGLDG